LKILLCKKQRKKREEPMMDKELNASEIQPSEVLVSDGLMIEYYEKETT